MSKLLLIHILAINRCLYEGYHYCGQLGYLHEREDLIKNIYCRAYGMKDAYICPIIEYTILTNSLGFEEMFHKLHDWKEYDWCNG